MVVWDVLRRTEERGVTAVEEDWAGWAVRQGAQVARPSASSCWAASYASMPWVSRSKAAPVVVADPEDLVDLVAGDSLEKIEQEPQVPAAWVAPVEGVGSVAAAGVARAARQWPSSARLVRATR